MSTARRSFGSCSVSLVIWSLLTAWAPVVAAHVGARLLVGNTASSDIVAFDQRTGRPLGSFVAAGSGGLTEPDALSIGPDGRLYVSSGETAADSAILRFDAQDGHFIDRFVTGGGLLRPYGHAFGPDGLLYVSSFLTDQILRYDAESGAFVDMFAQGTGTPGGVNGPNGLAFGPDGLLYLTTEGSIGGSFSASLPSEVLRFDIVTGESEVFIAQPLASPSGAGYVSLLGLAFGPDCRPSSCAFERPGRCDLFVSDFANDIRRYDRQGRLIAQYETSYTDTLPSTNAIGGLTFGAYGQLFTVGFDTREEAAPGVVLRFDVRRDGPHPRAFGTGAFFVPATPALRRPIGVLALP